MGCVVAIVTACVPVRSCQCSSGVLELVKMCGHVSSQDHIDDHPSHWLVLLRSQPREDVKLFLWREGGRTAGRDAWTTLANTPVIWYIIIVNSSLVDLTSLNSVKVWWRWWFSSTERSLYMRAYSDLCIGTIPVIPYTWWLFSWRKIFVIIVGKLTFTKLFPTKT